MSFVPFGGYSNSPLSSVSPFRNELQKHVGAFICYKMALPDYYAEQYELRLHFFSVVYILGRPDLGRKFSHYFLDTLGHN